jgi:hypothetical protein
LSTESIEPPTDPAPYCALDDATFSGSAPGVVGRTDYGCDEGGVNSNSLAFAIYDDGTGYFFRSGWQPTTWVRSGCTLVLSESGVTSGVISNVTLNGDGTIKTLDYDDQVLSQQRQGADCYYDLSPGI